MPGRASPSIPFEVGGIDHLVIRTRNLDALIEFYAGVLGCPVERRVDGIGLVQLRAGRSLVDIVDVDGELGRACGAQANCSNHCLFFRFNISPYATLSPAGERRSSRLPPTSSNR